MKSRKMKGFSLIELIVVMAIMAILVLVAGPKYLNYTKEAREKQIITDVKLANNILAEYFVGSNDTLPIGSSEIDAVILSSFMNENKLYDITGITNNIDENIEYTLIPSSFINKKIGSKLKGHFVTSSGGDVYYIDVKEDKFEIVNNEPIIKLVEAGNPSKLTAVIKYPANSTTQEYKIDDNEWLSANITTSYDNPLLLGVNATNTYYEFTVTISSNSTVCARATFPGNKSYEKEFKLEKPVIALSTIETTSSLTASIKFSDRSTTKEYRLASGEWVSYTGAITISANSTIYARGKDLNGNIIAYNTLNVTNILLTNNNIYSVKNNGNYLDGILLSRSVITNGIDGISQFTIEADTNGTMLFSTVSGDTGYKIKFNIYINDTGILYNRRYGGYSSTYYYNTADYPFNQDNKIHHIAISDDLVKNELNFYVDGELISTQTYSAKETKFSGGVGNFSPRALAYTYSSTRYAGNGSLDNLRIWGVARTPEQIREYYNKVLPNTEPGLIADFTFDNIVSSINSSSVGNHTAIVPSGMVIDPISFIYSE